MNYSPKLKRAAERIKKILRDEDIAALVVLHTPSFGEYVLHTDTSYSIAKPDTQKGVVRFKTDPKDNPEVKRQKTADTANMYEVLACVGGPIVLQCMNISDFLVKNIEGIEHRGGTWSSTNEQNN